MARWGPDLVARLRAVAPSTPVVCWATSASPEDAAEIIRAGAAGYVLKEDGPAEVVRALGPILDGGAVVSPRVSESQHRLSVRSSARTTTEASAVSGPVSAS